MPADSVTEPMSEHDEASPGGLSATGALPRLFADRYRLTARRGSGVDVAIFEAVDLVTNRIVAVKVVHPDLGGDPEFAGKFFSTMAAAAGVRHPNLAEVIEYGRASWAGRSVFFVVGEHLTGGSLRDLHDRGRRLTQSQAVMVGLDMCRGLDMAHQAGLVHGDLRPSSVVFGDDGKLRITDLGLASLVAGPLWRAPGGIGADRARYASPEQASGQPAGQKSDVYATTLCLIESLTGDVPFVGESTVATLSNRVDKLMPVSADLGPLAAVLERAGRPDPADRSTVAEFGKSLVQAAEKLPRPTPIALVGVGLFAEAEPAPALEVAPPAEPTPELAVAAEAVAADTVDESPDLTLQPPAPGTMVHPTAPVYDEASASAPAATALVEPSREHTPRRWPMLAAIAAALVAVAVALFVFLGGTSSHVVPPMAGLDRAAALNMVSQYQWSITDRNEASDSVPVGVVIRSDPEAGVKLDEGKVLTLVISAGPAPRVLPELSGLTVDDATAKLKAAGLVLQLGEQSFDETIPADTVISWQVPGQPGLVAGNDVVMGTVVEVKVSAGPEPRTVPSLAGRTLAEATATLQNLGLVIAQADDVFSSKVPVGSVVAQDPAADTKLDRGGTVTVAVSKGPDLVAVPALAALTVQQASDALAAAGLKLGKVKGDQAGVVVLSEANGQVLVAGAQLERGTAVDVTFMVPAASTVPATSKP